eukprot:4841613-Alexandrium_andersonii.AAC.1
MMLCIAASATAASVGAILSAVVAAACQLRFPAAAADGSTPAMPCSHVPPTTERPRRPRPQAPQCNPHNRP